MSRGVQRAAALVRSVAIALTLVLMPACASAQSAAPAAPAESTQQAAGELFLFLYRPGPTWRAGVAMSQQEGMRAHGAFFRTLVEQGRVFAGGGFVDIDGGMAIVRAANMDEARALLATDPAVIAGTFVADVRHWRPRFGAEHFRD